jgi:GT2 family glycosyltransferase
VEKSIEFILSTYNRTYPLICMVASLMAQKDEHWSALIVVDDVENDKVKNIVDKFGDDRIHYIFTETRYNNYGHTPHNIGKALSIADYIVMTNDDNYYVPTFITELRIAIEENPGMVYWDMIHNNYDYKLFSTTIADNKIDLGAFATRRDLAQQIDLNNNYAADAFYVK